MKAISSCVESKTIRSRSKAVPIQFPSPKERLPLVKEAVPSVRVPPVMVPVVIKAASPKSNSSADSSKVIVASLAEPSKDKTMSVAVLLPSVNRCPCIVRSFVDVSCSAWIVPVVARFSSFKSMSPPAAVIVRSPDVVVMVFELMLMLSTVKSVREDKAPPVKEAVPSVSVFVVMVPVVVRFSFEMSISPPDVMMVSLPSSSTWKVE